MVIAAIIGLISPRLASGIAITLYIKAQPSLWFFINPICMLFHCNWIGYLLFSRLAILASIMLSHASNTITLISYLHYHTV